MRRLRVRSPSTPLYNAGSVNDSVACAPGYVFLLVFLVVGLLQDLERRDAEPFTFDPFGFHTRADRRFLDGFEHIGHRTLDLRIVGDTIGTRLLLAGAEDLDDDVDLVRRIFARLQFANDGAGAFLLVLAFHLREA